MSNKINAETEVSTSELASVLGITGRRVRQLAEDGVLKKIKEGRFNLSQAIQSFISFHSLKERVTPLQGTEKYEAEVRIKTAKAIIAEMEADELQGKMHRSEDVAAMTEDLIYTIRGVLMAVPGRCSVDTAAAQTPAETFNIIRKEIHNAMRELAEYKYDPKKYEERVRERRAWEIQENEEDNE